MRDSGDGRTDAAGPEAGRIVDSWKSIAAHIGVTVRTVQLWEQEQGLPVYRQPGIRGRVFAFREELDAWRTAGREPRRAAAQSAAKAWQRVVMAAALAAGLVLACTALFLTVREAGGRPALHRIDGSFLVVLDQKGGELWRAPLPQAPNPADPDHALAIQPLFADLDGDGLEEVVFPYQRFDSPMPDQLICYSPSGRRMWTFNPGRAIRTGAQPFTNHYRLRSVSLLAPQGGRGPRVLVNARHEPDYPTQLVTLDAAGRMENEYWHSGHLLSTLVTDLDGDGASEIVLAGIVNGSKTSDLVVLDAARFGGASGEENPHYQILDMPPPEERARILFPRTGIARHLDHYGIPRTMLLAGDELSVHLAELTGGTVDTSFAYVFTRELRLKRVEPGDSTGLTYNALKAQRILPADFVPDSMEQLRAVRIVAPFIARSSQLARAR